jgi:uncharacterized metal-binding protein (TIGR02443 family)
MRRFIAGAVCPSCRVVDRIVVETSAAGQLRRCVACGHADTLTDLQAPTPATRFSGRGDAAAEVQPVRLLEPAPVSDRNISDGGGNKG